ncbi:hypothetical protein KR038_011017 [Drosophila bunnanda]|nr:hypothetical protein KR038_011017 [Drosophila bunnanda]
MSSGNEDPTSVAVALRVRPLVQSEVDRGCRIAVERTSPGAPQVIVNRSETFTFNHVFDVDATQREIYESCVLAKQRKLLQGYNVTILAYGQTGSGKTFTMGTSYNGVMDESAGVIPRAVDDIFREIAELQEEYSFSVTCSFVELYQEQFFDLFSPGKITVDIKEVNKRVVMPGLTELAVKSAQEVTDYLMRGSSGRAVAATAMNETSSRSHAIFTLTLVATKKDSTQSVTTSKFNLVDLAGSERCSKTLASGDRFKEGVNINKGLLALGNVINALGSANAPGYIPYRQSKLTRLLQDSLGGNSITLMIACVSPADYNTAETVSTLRYADRALQIKNKPVVNQDPHAAEVNMLKDIIQKLRVQLLGGGKMSSSITSAVGAAGLDPLSVGEPLDRSENQRLQEQVRSLQDRNRKLQEELHQSLVDLTEKEMRAHIAEQAHDALRAHVLQLRDKLEQQEQQASSSDGDDRLREISQLVEMVEDQLQRTQDELDSHGQETRHQLSSNGHDHGSSGNGGDEAHEMLQLQSEEYTDKQLNFASELRNINRQLDLKQELHVRIMRNFNKLEATDEDLKLRQCNQKIEDLEEERRSLLDQLRNIKSKDSSAKIAEERRKRLQSLEQEIADLRRKVVTQANMLKMREKEREKIKNLSDEIKIMKESKVKLIRTMRGESEKFRQLRMVHQKEVTQLKSKDRKMQSEMVRQQTLHAKQRQVLKRKCEEAMAANKRLKDALDRQASAQAQRQKSAKDHGAPSGASAKPDSWVDRELEIILSLVDAEHSLEQLMEDRAEVNKHYHMMEKQTSTNPADAQVQAKLLASLEEELEMRNAQISDLQQKVCQSDLDSRIRALSEGVHSIGESRSVSKQLLKTLVQQRRHQALSSNEQRTALDDVRAQLLEAQQLHEALTNRLKLSEAQHEEQMLSQQRSYEEKVAVLLRAPQLESLAGNTSKSKAAPKVPIADLDATVYMSDMNDSQEMVDSDDPDWLPHKKSKNKSVSVDSGAPQVNGAEVSNGSISSLNFTTAHEDGKVTKCKCRTKCNGKRCGCFLGSKVCSENCFCKGHCMNPFNVTQEPPEKHGDGELTQKENSDTFMSAEQQLSNVVSSPKRSHDQKESSTPLSDVNNAEQEGLSGPKLVR